MIFALTAAKEVASAASFRKTKRSSAKTLASISTVGIFFPTSMTAVMTSRERKPSATSFETLSVTALMLLFKRNCRADSATTQSMSGFSAIRKRKANSTI